jgi:multidrug efflux system membrane fusion protein
MVSKVPAGTGQRVKRGELLVSLDPRGFRARLNSARAESARAQAMLEEARREDERASELYDRTLLSDHERTKASIALREAEAVAAQAAASLVQARLDHERSQLKAPFDGLVLAVRAAPGQSIVSEYQSNPLVELASDSRMSVLSSADMATAREAAAAKVVVEVAGRRLEAESVEIGFEPVGQGQTLPRYELKVFFSRPEELELRAGEPARLLW